MQFLAVTDKTNKRLDEPVDKLNKIKRFGWDNLYPQQVEAAIQFSGTASSCAEIYQDFVQGEGFEDEELNNIVINRDGETMYDLLEYIAYDMSRHQGFSIHMNYNLLGEITELRRIKFKQCRLGVPDDRGYIGKVAISSKWTTAYLWSNKSADAHIKYIHKFNPIEKVLLQQIADAGTISKYTGQVLYWTPETDMYPLSPFDSVLEDIDTDAQIKLFKNNGIKTNFLASHIFKYFGDKEGEQALQSIEELKEELVKFQGPDSKKIMLALLGDVNPELAKLPLLEKVDIQNFDKLYEYTERSVRSNIIDSRKIPQALFSKFEGNALGQSSKIFSEAAQQYNRVTFRERMTIKRQLEKVAPLFPALRDRDFTIKELYSGYTQMVEGQDNQPNQQQNELTNQ